MTIKYIVDIAVEEVNLEVDDEGLRTARIGRFATSLFHNSRWIFETEESFFAVVRVIIDLFGIRHKIEVMIDRRLSEMRDWTDSYGMSLPLGGDDSRCLDSCIVPMEDSFSDERIIQSIKSNSSFLGFGEWSEFMRNLHLYFYSGLKTNIYGELEEIKKLLNNHICECCFGGVSAHNEKAEKFGWEDSNIDFSWMGSYEGVGESELSFGSVLTSAGDVLAPSSSPAGGVPAPSSGPAEDNELFVHGTPLGDEDDSGGGVFAFIKKVL